MAKITWKDRNEHLHHTIQSLDSHDRCRFSERIASGMSTDAIFDPMLPWVEMPGQKNFVFIILAICSFGDDFAYIERGICSSRNVD